MKNERSTSGKDLLLIFTRNPQLGKVKKRLAAGIGDEAALKIYNHLLQHTFEISRNLQVEKWVFYSEQIPQQDIFMEGNFRKKLQRGKDLGERMQDAFNRGFEADFKNIIIIGSDIYDLTEEDLKKAFLALQSTDAVIGPAMDGGYYLLGLKALLPGIFQDKIWGSNTVLKSTLTDLEDLKLQQLETRNDIDSIEDLRQHPDLVQLIFTKDEKKNF